MSRLLFVRSYLLIVIGIFLVGFTLDKVLTEFIVKSDKKPTEEMLLQGHFLYIEIVLKQQKKTLPLAWAQSKAMLKKELAYPLELYHISDFSAQASLVTLLNSGQVSAMLSDDGQRVYYRQLSGTDYLVALGPLYKETKHVLTDTSVMLIYYFCVFSALFLWLLPFSNDLHKLRKASVSFGAEDFSARVHLRKRSSIAPVANAFNFMAQHIEDLIVAHKDLTYAVSHELKTPLARFKFSLEIIASQADEMMREKYIQAMKGDVSELDDLVNEMLHYAKLSSRNLTLQFESVEGREWLEQIIAEYTETRINIRLDYSIVAGIKEKSIVIDCHSMSRAVNNLIRNGLRYANKQLTVSLHLADDITTICIEDDGCGIPEEHLEHVFQPFTRLDESRDRQSGGTGLGLAITQKIVHQHGGKIFAYRSSLGGAGFQLSWKDISL